MGINYKIHVQTEKRIISKTGEQSWENTMFFVWDSFKAGIKQVPVYNKQDCKLFKILGFDSDNDSNICIEPSRGFPSDAALITIGSYDAEFALYPSYLTLKELLDYEKKKKKYGMELWVPITEWAKYKKGLIDHVDLDSCLNEEPLGYHGYVKKKVSILHSGYRDFLKNVKKKARFDLDPDKFIDKKTLFRDYSENYRIVFWFEEV